jgi:sugar lactone lactonase YvrE
MRFSLLIALLTLGSVANRGLAQLEYPRVNTANVFEVDPKWPQRPEGLYWAAVSGLAVDKNDHVHVLTRTREPVQVYDTGGKLLRTWGGKDIDRPHQIRFDADGNVWITDIGMHTVMKFAADGKLLQTLGRPGKNGRDTDSFNMPTDIAFGPNGDLYISDGYGNARVMQFDKNGKFVRTWGELGSRPGEFSIAHSIACDKAGKVYVADRNNVRVQVFDSQGKFLEEWRDIILPWGLALKDGDLWVAGSSPMQWRKQDTNVGCPPADQLVMRFRTDGRLLQLFHFAKGMDGLERPGELNWVHCIAFDSRGNLYLGDIIGKRAQKFVPRPPQQ